ISGATPSTGTGPSAADEGSFYAYMEASTPNYPTKDAIMFSPCFNISSLASPEISFSYHMLGVPGTLRLEGSTDGVNWLQIWSAFGDHGSNWQRDTVGLGRFAQTTQLRLRFFGTTESSWQGDICVDDIRIESPVAPCLPPSNLAVNNVQPTSADLSWTTSPSATDYTLRYQILGSGSWTTINNVTGTSYSLTGLTANRTYEWELTANCGTAAAQAVAGPHIVTPQPSNCSQLVNTFPYYNSFEKNLEWNNVWGDDFDWWRQSGNTPSSGTGPSKAADGSWYAYMEVSKPNYPQKTAWLESPCFDLTQVQNPEISFQYHMLGSPGNVLLELSTDGFNWTTMWSVSGNQGTNWLGASVNLANYASSNQVRFRFNGTSAFSWQGDICVDDIRIGAAQPACLVPSGLKVSNIQATSATLSWDPVAAAVSYDLQYREKGLLTWTFVNNIATTSYTVTGMFIDSTYEWRLRSNCGNQQYSGWEDGPDFVPQQVLNCVFSIPFFPFVTDFEGSLGWFNDANDDFDWTRISGPTSSTGTGPDSAAQGDYYAYMEVSTPNFPQKSAILYSPCFNLTNTSDLHISFSYHMLGLPGSLSLDVSVNGTTWTQLWTVSGDQGSNWIRDTVSLVNYHTASGLRLRFRGISGSSWQGDIAIDDILMFEMPQTIEPSFDEDLAETSGQKILIAPNPFSDRLDIMLPEAAADFASVEIFSLSGKKVWERKGLQTGLRTSLYPDIAAGMYVIRIRAGKLEESIKLVKTK
ncbi:MAG: fibronectin type III domain-containing protein, partial [Bacteroidia bacterium]